MGLGCSKDHFIPDCSKDHKETCCGADMGVKMESAPGLGSTAELIVDGRKPVGIEESFHMQGTYVKIYGAENRGITLHQLNTVFEHMSRRCYNEGWWNTNPAIGGRLLPKDVNLYDLNTYEIMPATKPYKCSYVELMADGPQPPTWFVSHWWGEPIRCFIMCLSQHTEDRVLQGSCVYWVCAYANNQHNLKDNVPNDPNQTSFCKAMGLAQGTVSILDENKVTYSRIWCAYEIFKSIQVPDTNEVMPISVSNLSLIRKSTESLDDSDDGLHRQDHTEYKYDVYTTVGNMAVGLTDGLCERDLKGIPTTWVSNQTKRQQVFPVAVIMEALKVKLQCAKATEPADRKRILNSIVGNEDLDAEPPEEHAEYEELNSILAGRFASAGWVNALENKGDMEVLKAALRTSQLKKFVASFGASTSFKAEDFNILISAFPDTLQILRLDFYKCNSVRDEGVTSFAQHLPERLRFLHLNIASTSITDAAIRAIGEHLPPRLHSLRLNAGQNKITDESIQFLAQNLPLGLTTLDLRVGNVDSITDLSLVGIASHIPEDLKVLDIGFTKTQVSEKGVEALIQGLAAASAMSVIKLFVINTKVDAEARERLLAKMFEKWPATTEIQLVSSYEDISCAR